jgi:hypothetical protein
VIDWITVHSKPFLVLRQPHSREGLPKYQGQEKGYRSQKIPDRIWRMRQSAEKKRHTHKYSQAADR